MITIKTVPFYNTALKGFWKNRYDINLNSSIETVYKRFSQTGRFEAFKCNWQEGKDNKPHIFWDSDVAKWIESVAYTLAYERNERLEKIVDEVVDEIEKNQDELGYFNIYYTVVEPENRFTNRDNHELYCAGHLTEAAVAYYQATGKDKFLKLMCRYMDYIEKVFMVEDSAKFSTPGHEEIELALIKLYGCTKEERYLKLCEHFVNTRGTSSKDDNTRNWVGNHYDQTDVPVREIQTAKGHSVRAVYLYCGMADLFAKTGDKSLFDACDRVFDDIATKQMYITGGIGATEKGEAFTESYVLPNDIAYSETCAAIGLALFARRMSAICPDSKYADVAERAIYNGILSGVSLDGHSFFYVNPLEINLKRHRANEEHYNRKYNLLTQRKEVFDCSCCPPNISRFLASIADFLYTYNDTTIFVHHFMDSHTKIESGKISQQTRYPNEGDVRITVKGLRGKKIAVRIPDWCEFASVNAEKIENTDRGYCYLDITEDEQVFDFYFKMTPKAIASNPEIEANLDRVAVTRGPIVYCAERVLNDNIPLNNFYVKLPLEYGLEFCDKINSYKMTVNGYKDCHEDKIYLEHSELKTEKVKISLLPYFAFANHGESDMLVWLRYKEERLNA